MVPGNTAFSWHRLMYRMNFAPWRIITWSFSFPFPFPSPRARINSPSVRGVFFRHGVLFRYGIFFRFNSRIFFIYLLTGTDFWAMVNAAGHGGNIWGAQRSDSMDGESKGEPTPTMVVEIGKDGKHGRSTAKGGGTHLGGVGAGWRPAGSSMARTEEAVGDVKQVPLIFLHEPFLLLVVCSPVVPYPYYGSCI